MESCNRDHEDHSDNQDSIILIKTETTFQTHSDLYPHQKITIVIVKKTQTTFQTLNDIQNRLHF